MSIQAAVGEVCECLKLDKVKEVSEHTGISTSTLYTWRKEPPRFCRALTLVRLCRYYGVDLDVRNQPYRGA